MELLPIIFSVVLIILTVVVAVVGVQLFLVLLEIKRTLKKVNTTLDMAEEKFNAVVAPLQNLGGMASGLSAGFKVFESFVGWLQRNPKSEA